LSPAQRAVAAAEAIGFWAKEAKERQVEAGKLYGENHPKAEVSVPGGQSEKGRAADKAGKMFDVSGSSVERAKVVLEHGTDDEIADLKAGKAALAPLEKAVRERVANAPAAKPTFNRTTDSIEWAQWTWNPVTGCKHGYFCFYDWR